MPPAPPEPETQPESEPEPDRSSDYNPRMHQGGKLSFRGRVQGGEDDPGEFLAIGGDNPPGLRDLAPADMPVEIEIGPGKGAFVLAAVAAKPETFILGIEAAVGYASLAATKLKASGHDNGLLLVDNGKLFLQDRVEPGALHALHVYFPDPWPKRRHRGRRFFTDDVTPVVTRALRDDGYCYVATDNAAYAGQIARVLGACPELVRDPDEEARVIAAGPGHAFSPTNFERKYIEEGRVIRRYAFRRIAR
ncbi:MAG: hypothetical protein NXI31_26045 [bacterium]|nr:hypothetical protein [bacterium]